MNLNEKMGKDHAAKIRGAAIAAGGLVLYYAVMGVLFIKANFSIIIEIAAAFMTLAITALFVFVLIERIKEIKSGEEDDLSKY